MKTGTSLQFLANLKKFEFFFWRFFFSPLHEREILTESFFSKNKKKFAKMVEIRHKKYSGVSSARQKRADRDTCKL
jgi:hypothetical protein